MLKISFWIKIIIVQLCWGGAMERIIALLWVVRTVLFNLLWINRVRWLVLLCLLLIIARSLLMGYLRRIACLYLQKLTWIWSIRKLTRKFELLMELIYWIQPYIKFSSIRKKRKTTHLYWITLFFINLKLQGCSNVRQGTLFRVHK
jgi:hypothetical protein